MHLSLAGKFRFLRDIIPFLIFSYFYEKDIKAKAAAEGLTFEEYKRKYYVFTS